MLTGPDPADPNRVLIRKVIQIGENSYAYEETRLTRSDNKTKAPEVHTVASKLHGFDLKENLDN